MSPRRGWISGWFGSLCSCSPSCSNCNALFSVPIPSTACRYVNHDFFAIGLGLVIDAIICIFLGFVGWQYASVRSEDDLHTGESEYSWRHYLQIYRYPMWIICVMNLGVIENYPDFDSLWFKFWIQAPLFFLARRRIKPLAPSSMRYAVAATNFQTSYGTAPR